jgi:hypothetical protein
MKLNKEMKRLITHTFMLAVAILATVSKIHGQADPSFRQNQFNILMLNPAQAGANSYNDISVLASRSLVGFTGAPKTYTASGNFRVFNNLGLGVTAFRDQLGPVTTTRGSLNLAYHLKMNNKWNIALGIRGMISSMNKMVVSPRRSRQLRAWSILARMSATFDSTPLSDSKREPVVRAITLARVVLPVPGGP